MPPSATVDSESAGRLYRSRKSRPCDSCRRRKVVCDMPEGPPCHRCSSRTLSCTFEHGPGLRKRRQVMETPSPPSRLLGLCSTNVCCRNDAGNLAHLFLDLGGESAMIDERDIMLDDLPDMSMSLQHPHQPSTNFFNFQTELHAPSPQSQSRISRHARSRRSRSDRSSITSQAENSHSTGESLELVPDAFSFYIGPTGAADVHLLAREEFDSNNITRPKIPGLKYRRLQSSSSRTSAIDLHPTIFGITDQSLLKKAEPRADEDAIEAAWSELWQIINPDIAWRLIKLYSRFVDPYFPILAPQQLPSSPDELANMSLGLLASICASALPFVVYDEGLYTLLLHPPDSSKLYRICWLDISQHLHAPTLATLQSCLILQQRPPTNPYLSDTAFAWSLMSTAVAVAQTIGLHRDPMGWGAVPLWERQLRKRLWWALWMMERWISLVRGMPSHVNDDDFDVEEMSPETMGHTLSTSEHAASRLHQLVKLTRILADIQKTYYTARTMSRTSNDLQLSLDLARTPRTQLKSWLENLEPSLQSIRQGASAEGNHGASRASQAISTHSTPQQVLDGNASIYLSYIVTHMTLFRALLRPLSNSNTTSSTSTLSASTHEGAKAVIKGSIVCTREFVDFLETLRDPQWNAFWHSWSRPNFAIAGSFMVHLLHVTSAKDEVNGRVRFEDEDGEVRGLVRRWRVANRSAANGAAGAKGLANLGLLRVETMLGRLMRSEDGL
ncbi:hypothetical protein CC79DRAFT_1314664 [Sarocladium strictum]